VEWWRLRAVLDADADRADVELRPLEHFQEKWPPVFRRKCDQVSNLDRIPITRDRNTV
jgi:hypothetical protein